MPEYITTKVQLNGVYNNVVKPIGYIINLKGFDILGIQIGMNTIPFKKLDNFDQLQLSDIVMQIAIGKC